MFTGLVESVGVLCTRKVRGGGARVGIETRLGSLVLGESIAVDGVCLTVDQLKGTVFEADASVETLTKTTLGSVPLGRSMNLERAMPLGGRMGGHMVSGHVDGVGALIAKSSVGDAVALTFSMPHELARYVSKKGSICVSGVSLTVNEVTSTSFDVVVIPRTLRDTSLRELALKEHVNLEVDLIARYLERLTSGSSARGVDKQQKENEAWLARLADAGYL